MAGLRPFSKDVWTLSGGRVSFYGIPFATRAVIVRLCDGGLWVHSPVADAAALQEVDALGRVAHLVEPNKIHSLGLKPARALWPQAKAWVSPGFGARHPDIPYDEVLGDAPPPAWAHDIDQCVFSGHALLDEVVFLHRPSRSLIVTDLIQKHDDGTEAWPWRMIKRLVGIWGPRGGTAPDIRLGFRDREAARTARDRILGWDFDRLILSHGLCLETGAKDEVRRVWKFLD